MSNRTLINGTAYDIKSGSVLIEGTGYAIQKGRTLINGTGYDISIAQKLYLYDQGNEYAAITGGWNNITDFTQPADISKFQMGTFQIDKKTDEIYIYDNISNYNDVFAFFGTNSMVDLSAYSTLKAELRTSSLSQNLQQWLYLDVWLGKRMFDDTYRRLRFASSGETIAGTLSLDISGASMAFVGFMVQHSGYGGSSEIAIKKVWLE